MSDVRSPLRTRPMRERAAIINRNLRSRLDTVLPLAMRETGFDMWIVLCQEDNPDPVFTTMIPMDTWCPILQLLVFCDRGAAGVERINISGVNTHDLYDRPYRGQLEREQWPLLRQIVEERDPKRIGINIGAIQWAAGGLTHNLYQQLVAHLPERYVARLQSAEPLATRWLATLTDDEIATFEEVARLGRGIIAECYTPAAITPGVTTTTDLEWFYWQRCRRPGAGDRVQAVLQHRALRRGQSAVRGRRSGHPPRRPDPLRRGHPLSAAELRSSGVGLRAGRGGNGCAGRAAGAPGRGQPAAGCVHGRVSARAHRQPTAGEHPGAGAARRASPTRGSIPIPSASSSTSLAR